MKLKKLFFSLSISILLRQACADDCGPGYYYNDNNGICTKCENPYYCPGDNIKHECPSAQNFCDLLSTTESGTTSITCIIDAWSPRESITDCHAIPLIQNDCGTFNYNIRYATNTQSYPPQQNTNKYWTVANDGHYLATYASGNAYRNCTACTNAPANAHYTAPGTPDVGDCPWECDSGYGQTDSGACLPLCSTGVTEFHVRDLSFNIYANKQTTPSINIKYNDTVCYVSLAVGATTNALHIEYQDTVYHTIN